MKKEMMDNQELMQISLGSKENPMNLVFSGHDQGIQLSFKSKDSQKRNLIYSGHKHIWIPPPAKSTRRIRECCLYKYHANEIMLTLPKDGKFLLPNGFPLVIESQHLENFKAAFYPPHTTYQASQAPIRLESTSPAPLDDYGSRLRDSYKKQLAAIKESEKLIQEHENRKSVLSKHICTLKKNLDEIGICITEIERQESGKVDKSLIRHKQSRKQAAAHETSSAKSSYDRPFDEIEEDMGQTHYETSKNYSKNIPKIKCKAQHTDIEFPPEKMIKKLIQREGKFRKIGKDDSIPSSDKVPAENVMIKLADNMRKSKELLDSALVKKQSNANLQKKYIQEVETLYEDQQRLLKDILQALDCSSTISLDDDNSESSSDQKNERTTGNLELKKHIIDEYEDIERRNKAKFKLNSMPDISSVLRNQYAAEQWALAKFELEKLKKEIQLLKTKGTIESIQESDWLNKDIDAQKIRETVEVKRGVNRHSDLGTDSNFKEVIGSIIHKYNILQQNQCEANSYETTLTQKVRTIQNASKEQKPEATRFSDREADARKAMKKLEETIKKILPVFPKVKGQPGVGPETPITISHREENISANASRGPEKWLINPKYNQKDEEEKKCDRETQYLNEEKMQQAGLEDNAQSRHIRELTEQNVAVLSPRTASQSAEDQKIEKKIKSATLSGEIIKKEIRLPPSKEDEGRLTSQFPSSKDTIPKRRHTFDNAVKLTNKGSLGFEVSDESKLYSTSPIENQHTLGRNKNFTTQDHRENTPTSLLALKKENDKQTKIKKFSKQDEGKSEIENTSLSDSRDVLESTRIDPRDTTTGADESLDRAHLMSSSLSEIPFALSNSKPPETTSNNIPDEIMSGSISDLSAYYIDNNDTQEMIEGDLPPEQNERDMDIISGYISHPSAYYIDSNDTQRLIEGDITAEQNERDTNVISGYISNPSAYYIDSNDTQELIEGDITQEQNKRDVAPKLTERDATQGLIGRGLINMSSAHRASGMDDLEEGLISDISNYELEHEAGQINPNVNSQHSQQWYQLSEVSAPISDDIDDSRIVSQSHEQRHPMQDQNIFPGPSGLQKHAGGKNWGTSQTKGISNYEFEHEEGQINPNVNSQQWYQLSEVSAPISDDTDDSRIVSQSQGQRHPIQDQNIFPEPSGLEKHAGGKNWGTSQTKGISNYELEHEEGQINPNLNSQHSQQWYQLSEVSAPTSDDTNYSRIVSQSQGQRHPIQDQKIFPGPSVLQKHAGGKVQGTNQIKDESSQEWYQLSKHSVPTFYDTDDFRMVSQSQGLPIQDQNVFPGPVGLQKKTDGKVQGTNQNKDKSSHSKYSQQWYQLREHLLPTLDDTDEEEYRIPAVKSMPIDDPKMASESQRKRFQMQRQNAFSVPRDIQTSVGATVQGTKQVHNDSLKHWYGLNKYSGLGLVEMNGNLHSTEHLRSIERPRMSSQSSKQMYSKYFPDEMYNMQKSRSQSIPSEYYGRASITNPYMNDNDMMFPRMLEDTQIHNEMEYKNGYMMAKSPYRWNYAKNKILLLPERHPRIYDVATSAQWQRQRQSRTPRNDRVAVLSKFPPDIKEETFNQGHTTSESHPYDKQQRKIKTLYEEIMS